MCAHEILIKSFRRDERGFSLVSILIAVGLLGLGGVILSSILTKTMKGNRSVQMTDELTNMKRVLRNKIDCKKTLDKQSCPSINKYFPLKDKNDRIIGVNHGKFWKFGSWSLRALCTEEDLNIEFAQTDNHGSFKKDPLTNKTHGWDNLFLDGELSCSSIVKDLSPNKPPKTGCKVESGICPDQMRADWKIMTADLNYDPNWKNSECHGPVLRHFTGVAMCPVGYVPAGGGGECAIPPWGGILVSSRIVSPFSSFKLKDDSTAGFPMRTMYINNTKQFGWYVDCCSFNPNEKAPDGLNFKSTAKSQVYVLCVPDE